MSVDELAESGRIEIVRPDAANARRQLARAREHLVSAEVLSGRDPDGPYAMLYDAARKAVTAHMLAAGWRVRGGRPGAHEAVALYAEATLGDDPHAAAVRQLNRMRRTRNRVEYGGGMDLSATELRADLERAREIVTAVEAAWPL